GYSDFGRLVSDVKQQAALIKYLLDNQKRDKPLLLVGSSYGGPVAARLLMDYPECADGVVFVSSSLAPGEEKTYGITYPTSKPYMSWLLPRTIRQANTEKLRHKRSLDAMDSMWTKVKVPYLILHGEEDGLIYPENANYAKRKLGPNRGRIIWVKRRGHGLPWSEPVLVQEAILEMISNLRNGAVATSDQSANSSP
ncbi:MAG: alpha/beta hydrolase, partial [Cytophagales bacterium]|nr:alpha/beta hydrolase [Cytophagales bacterium]